MKNGYLTIIQQFKKTLNNEGISRIQDSKLRKYVTIIGRCI